MIWAAAGEQELLDQLTQVTLKNLEDEHFGGRELALATGMSLSTLNRRLQAITGRTSNQFIRDVRMEKARELLLGGELTVAEISYMVGYTSPSYFTKRFHDHYGYVPGEAGRYAGREDDTEQGSPGGWPARFGGIPKKTLSFFNSGAPLFKKIAVYLFTIMLLIILFVFIVTMRNESWRRITGRNNTVKTLAVLPLKNLSPDPDNQYLADGITEDIINNLCQISDLRVLSRTTTETFRDGGYSIPEISKMIKADFLLEGSVRREGQRLRITVQLIDGESDHHLWSENYDRPMADIFDIQGDIALNVAKSLRVLLSSHEIDRIEMPGTRNIVAYDFYLRGKDYEKRSYEGRDFFLAKQMYEKAVAIDPGFALAWAGLAAVKRQLYWFYHDRSEANLSQAKEALDIALALLPTAKMVQVEEAMYHYQCRKDYPESLRLLELLNTRYPEDGDFYFWMGMVNRRMGAFHKSIEQCNKAIYLNPFDWRNWCENANSHSFIGEYSQAEQSYSRAIELNPSNVNTYGLLFNFYLLYGQISKANEFLIRHEYYFDPLVFRLFTGKLEYFAGDYDKAIQTIGPMTDDRQLYSRQSECYSKHLPLAMCYRSMSDEAMAAFHFGAERDIMLGLIRDNVNDDRLYRTLGIACAGLGLREEARQAASRAFEIRHTSIDRFQGCLTEVDLVKILVLLKEYDEALVRLEPLIRDCGFISTSILQHDPFWDPLRDYELFGRIVSDPSFQASF